MRWWTWIWIGFVAWLTIGGAWDDHRDRRRPFGIVLGLASGCVCIASILAFSFEDVAAAIGRWLAPLCLLAGCQIAIEAVREVRTLAPDAELSARENRTIAALGVLAVVVTFGAAVLVGVRIGVRHW